MFISFIYSYHNQHIISFYLCRKYVILYQISDLVHVNYFIKYIIYILRFVIYINLYAEMNSLIIDNAFAMCYINNTSASFLTIYNMLNSNILNPLFTNITT